MAIINDNGINRTFEQQLMHLTAAHRKQLETNEEIRQLMGEVIIGASAFFTIEEFVDLSKTYSFEQVIVNASSIKVGSVVDFLVSSYQAVVSEITQYGFKVSHAFSYKGTDGNNGYTPEIGANGNWWINGVDTGKPSKTPSMTFVSKTGIITNEHICDILSFGDVVSIDIYSDAGVSLNIAASPLGAYGTIATNLRYGTFKFRRGSPGLLVSTFYYTSTLVFTIATAESSVMYGSHLYVTHGTNTQSRFFISST